MFKTFIFGLFFVLALPGCQRRPAWDDFSEAGSRGPVLAQVNDWKITPVEFAEEVEEIIAANNQNPQLPVLALGMLFVNLAEIETDEIDLSTDSGKRIYLDYLVRLNLLAQKAQEKGIDRRREVMRRARRQKAEFLSLALLEDISDEIRISSLEVEDFYHDRYRRALEAIEVRKVREIVVASEPEARKVLVKILQDEDFAELAKRYSLADSASEGGNLGYISYQPGVKFIKFWEAVLTLRKGQVSNVLQDPEAGNYYLVKVEDIRKEEPEPLSAIYGQIEQLLKLEKRVDILEELIDEAKSGSEVLVNFSLMR